VSGIRFYFLKWVSDTYFFGVEGFMVKVVLYLDKIENG
jgi:hypothetical protein